MNAEQARQLTHTSIDTLAQQLNAGRSDQLKAYLATLGRFHRYSFGNIILIACQKPDATHVAGFHTWKSLGRFVKKGEKALTIIAPMLIKPKDETPAPVDGEARKPIMRFKAVHVFDLSQTDGEPLPEPVKVGGEPGEYLGRLKAAITNSGISLEEQTLSPGLSGYCKDGKHIVINTGMPAGETFSVLVHEYAHALLHFGPERPACKNTREIEAESIAFVVASAIGLDTATAASDYLSLYQGDAKALAASLETIQKTACKIIEAIQPQAQGRQASELAAA